MAYIDMHCDTLMLAALKDKKRDLFSRKELRVDFQRMKAGGTMAQFFAIFFPDDETYKLLGMKPMKDQEYFDLLFEYYLKSMKAHSNIIKPAHTLQDLNANWKNGKMSGILTMEDGRIINGDLDKLDDFYDLGIRAIALTWNHANCFGFPHSENREEMNRGLTKFGKEAVEYMNEIGMMIDVSHLSEGGFWDVVRISDKPFIASHSNCRAICPHSRNMSDEMIKALGEKGGVMGLNFYPAFLNKDISDQNARLEIMAEHIMHMIRCGGIEVAALGSDFDGMDGNLEIASCEEYLKLFEFLQKKGLSEDDIEKITHKNVMRVMKDTLW